MNTCKKCGCYIPDNCWQCIACGALQITYTPVQATYTPVQATYTPGSGGAGVANNLVCGGGGSGTSYTPATGKIIFFKWEDTDE